MRKLKWSQLTGMNQHYRRYSFEEYLDSMLSCGIESLELWCGAPHFMLDPKNFSDPKPYERMARERGMRFVSVCAPSMMWQYQFGVEGRERQKKAVAYYQNGIRVAAALGCKIMSINAGWGYRDEPANESMKRSAEAILKAADLAEREGVTLALETLQPTESNMVLTLKDARAFYKKLNHPAVKMMIDTVAAGVAGETVEDWFLAFGKDLVHCHFVDGSPSGHKVFGDGNYPVVSMLHTFERFDYQGFLTMELGESYINDPFSADKRNTEGLRKLIAN